MDAHHREALEQGLLAAFERQVRPRAARRVRWPHYAIAALAVASLLVASQAPAELEVDVGQRITIELGAEAGGAELAELGRAVSETLEPPSRPGIVLGNVRVDAEAGPMAVLTVDVWGNPLRTEAETRERVQGLSGMAAARVRVAPLRGHVRDTMLRKFLYLVHHDATPAELSRARQQLVDELRQKEADGALDVNISVDDATHRVRVEKVKRPK
ncbi:hypothetical protein [Pendulispora albinea]|uniref:Uncharacterized protein n=1 Tax=Pendulispora albinea TaxID=2741071 RepID=A0ABZ2LLW6_9BACT